MYDSVILKADSLIFGSRKLGTFCNGGVLDFAYWWRNSEHFLHLINLHYIIFWNFCQVIFFLALLRHLKKNA